MRLGGKEYWDAFMIEARAVSGGEIGALTGVGRWVSPPADTATLDCLGRPASALASASPQRRTNVIDLRWQAPPQDVGDIYFIASVAVKERYWIFTSERLSHRRSPFGRRRFVFGFLLLLRRADDVDDVQFRAWAVAARRGRASASAARIRCAPWTTASTRPSSKSVRARARPSSPSAAVSRRNS